MKKLMLVSFALALVMSRFALAQEYPQSGAMKQETPMAEKMSAKAVTVSGTVGADGTTFVDTVAPSLDQKYRDTIDGIRVSSLIGPCCHAVTLSMAGASRASGLLAAMRSR